MNGEPTEIAWAAGIFEGEGCVVIPRAAYAAGTGGVALRCLNAEEDVMQRFHGVVDCGTMRRIRPAREGWKPTFEWHAGSAFDVLTVLTAFWPYLGERRRDRAMQAFERIGKMGDGGRLPKGLVEMQVLEGGH